METLRTYLKTLSPLDQADFARRAGTTLGYLRKALSKGQRFGGALVRQLHVQSGGRVGLTDLRPDIWPADEQQPSRVAEMAALIDSRMSKRVLRARLGLSTDKQLAKVLKLPIEQVEGWSEEDALPALPQIQRLLGVQEQPQAQPEPHDPDENRYAPLEVA
ncbi:MULTISPECIES: hypothetical protein [unclassified Stenotrophomonas]|uniref:hypothetical protein n=1 Tax=unclassified Stenotrophomonas TaxID=196198 RepID=UPI002449CB82|nr:MULTISPECIES: hypothetical protein [unclassified Stenotrophomonas]MDG9843783.1 hypothetical protein [Stenotrophomonas sp. GD04054]MDH0016601.1 hypothetical protein [Stenotrophomonas sp. GD04028]MDH0577573.1 hypothetical protein [Stenotrophomonas sp. GD03997]MDH0859458.1 hypothetical protein [Stenotrophomonas sp. GD03882]